MQHFWLKYNLDRSTTHPKFDLMTRVQTHDLKITNSTFHIPETLLLNHSAIRDFSSSTTHPKFDLIGEGIVAFYATPNPILSNKICLNQYSHGITTKANKLIKARINISISAQVWCQLYLFSVPMTLQKELTSLQINWWTLLHNLVMFEAKKQLWRA